MHFNKALFPNKIRNMFQNKTRNLYLLPLWTVSACQGPVLGPAQSIQKGLGISFCSCPGLSLPDRPHSLVRKFPLLQDHSSIPAFLKNNVHWSCWGPKSCICIRIFWGIHGDELHLYNDERWNIQWSLTWTWQILTNLMVCILQEFILSIVMRAGDI